LRGTLSMEKVTFNNIIGFVLAVAFAIVMATCMWAVLAGDYMQGGNATLPRQPVKTLSWIRQWSRIVGHTVSDSRS